MAALGAGVKAPSQKDYGGMVCAGVVHASTGAGGVETLTIDPDYPPIKLGIQSPILAIILIENETPANDINEIFLPAGQMPRADAPTGVGEFQISGIREVKIWQVADLNGNALVFYLAEGTGHIH